MTLPKDEILSMGVRARAAAQILRNATRDQKNHALQLISKEILREKDVILAANALDRKQAQSARLTAAALDRLELTSARIDAMAAAVASIADLPEPCDRVLAEWDRPNGLHIRRVSVPIGVIAVIYEARPNVTADAAALCLKSGNAVILRGGSECFASAQAILQPIHRGLVALGLPSDIVQMIPTPDRESVDVMLSMDRYIDVIIPRGGAGLVQHIRSNSRIPVFEHLHGLCHTYVHAEANADMAEKVVINAKLRRVGICGATETLLLDRAILQTQGVRLVRALLDQNCEVRGDADIQTLDPRVKVANPEDWDTEYLDRIISVKVVANVDEAIEHINTHGSQHTDAILTENKEVAAYFIHRVDSAIVMHNASTQFADGGEFGMGAEIGIATGKLHARGPVGIEQLTTFHYEVLGTGQIRPVA